MKIINLNKTELIEINGGSEFSEGVFKILGMLAKSCTYVNMDNPACKI